MKTTEVCQHREMPCVVSINVMAGLCEPCEVCRPLIPDLRECRGYFKVGQYWHTKSLTVEQQQNIGDTIAFVNSTLLAACRAAIEIGSCDDCNGENVEICDGGFSCECPCHIRDLNINRQLHEAIALAESLPADVVAGQVKGSEK